MTASSADSGEPGITHMREALQRGIPVVTSNKWPVALHGVELAELRARREFPFRAESTVMSGTPVPSTLMDGLAGTTPICFAAFSMRRPTSSSREWSRDVVPGRPRRGTGLGLAERDPTADVEGSDTMAKAMILGWTRVRTQLRPEDVVHHGISKVDRAQIDAAASKVLGSRSS